MPVANDLFILPWKKFFRGIFFRTPESVFGTKNYFRKLIRAYRLRPKIYKA